LRIVIWSRRLVAEQHNERAFGGGGGHLLCSAANAANAAGTRKRTRVQGRLNGPLLFMLLTAGNQNGLIVVLTATKRTGRPQSSQTSERDIIAANDLLHQLARRRDLCWSKSLTALKSSWWPQRRHRDTYFVLSCL
jgi:hypothetical protein